MENILMNKLKKNEMLLWSCKPEAFTFMDTTHSAAYKKKWLTVGAVCAGVLAFYLFLVLQYGAIFNALVPGMLLVVLGYGLLSDRMEAKKLANQTIYAMTDKRIMVVMGVSMTSAEWAAVPDFTFETDADGHTHLLCGDWPAKEKKHQRRAATVRGVCVDANTGACRSAVMYAITDVEQAKRVLEENVVR